MISINNKNLQKPYGLYRTQFLTQLFTEAFERKITNSTYNLSDYESILGPKAIKTFKPAMWEAMEELRLNKVAIATGLTEVPPVIVAPIAININLPITLPAHTDIQVNATANQIAVWKIKAEITNDFLKAKANFKEKIKGMIPEEIFNTLVIQGGTSGWAAIEPADAFELILSDEYGKVSADILKKSVEQISKLWQKNIPLKSNLESMTELNTIIGTAFSHLMKSDQELFRIAHDIAILPQYDLATTVDDFMKLPGQNYELSLFSVFSKYLLSEYIGRRKLPNLGHLAFSDEPRYVQNINQLAMAVSAITDDGGLALAANVLPIPSTAKANLPVWKKGEYDEYQKLKAKKSKFVPPPPPPGTPETSRFGKICFKCGWNGSHNSKTCPVMNKAPAGSFTNEQMNLIQFDPKTDPHLIDKKPINQTFAPGIYGNT